MPSSATRCAAASLAALMLAGTVHAQVVRSVQAAPSTSPSRAVPSASARAAQAAPNPAGLAAPFPAGLTSGSGAAVSNDPVAAANSVTRGNAGTGTPPTGSNGGVGGGGVLDPGADGVPNVNTAILGAGPLLARGPAENVPLGGSGVNPVAVARGFLNGDINRDGELTRAEWLSIGLPLGFEEIDRNFDGVVTRFEYEDIF